MPNNIERLTTRYPCSSLGFNEDVIGYRVIISFHHAILAIDSISSFSKSNLMTIYTKLKDTPTADLWISSNLYGQPYSYALVPKAQKA